MEVKGTMKKYVQAEIEINFMLVDVLLSSGGSDPYGTDGEWTTQDSLSTGGGL